MPKKRKLVKKTRSKSKWYKSNTTWAIAAGVLFVAALVALAFVNTPHVTGNIISGKATSGTSLIKDMFTQWSAGNLDVNIAKYLYLFVVIIFIFSVLNAVEIPPNGFFQFILSTIIGFLATAYLTPDQVYVLLAEYDALGILITFIVPFLILFLFSANILSPIKITIKGTKYRAVKISQVLMVIFIWISFTVFMFYRLIKSWAHGVPWDSALSILMMVLTGLGLLMIFFNGIFRKWIDKIGKGLVREYRTIGA